MKEGMDAQAINEFPFVEDMPKKAKSRLKLVWEQFQELSKLSETEGILVPQRFVAKLLDLSPQRVDQLAKDGRLKRVHVHGHPFITENSVVELALQERKSGRPVKVMGVDVAEGSSVPGRAALAKAALKWAAKAVD